MNSLPRLNPAKNQQLHSVCANDAHALEAVIHASDLVDAVLVVEADKLDELKALLVSLGKNPDDFAIEVVPEGMHPSVCAAKLIHAGKADFLMKGKIMTGNLLKGVLSPDADLRTGSLMSHVMLFEVPGYHKLLGVTDGGMCTYPDLEKKVGIVKNAVRFFHKIGVEKPNVAALCAIETINPKMQETVDGAELKRMSLAGELGECYVEGPISYDLAMVPELSAVKGYTACPCCGDFDILLGSRNRCRQRSRQVPDLYLRRQNGRHRYGLQGSHRAHQPRFQCGREVLLPRNGRGVCRMSLGIT